MFNSFGNILRITTFGESHGPAVGVVVDGIPAGIPIDVDSIQQDLNRRRPGQNQFTTQRNESDAVEILSGVFSGKTTGAPVMILIRNQDQRTEDYESLKNLYRPSHADYTYQQKFGIRDYRGGGRSSARETVGRVAAAALVKPVLKSYGDIGVTAWVESMQEIQMGYDGSVPVREKIESSPLRCPDPVVSVKMEERLEQLKAEGNSAGGTIRCVAQNVPVGFGEPIYQKLQSALGAAMLSLPAVKGFDYGSGFDGTKLSGKEHNDEFFLDESGNVRTKTNHSGGIQGGISNGENIVFRVGFKPTSTIRFEQNTVNLQGDAVHISATGRHDPCVLPRAVPVVEAMTILVLADFALLNKCRQ